MNLREEILKEHSKPHALKIANYACECKKNFTELMNCFLDEEYRLAQRAAWCVSFAAQKQPQMIYPHIKNLVAVLQKKNVHDAVIRHSVRVLQQIELPVKFHGEVMDGCFKLLENPTTPVAIKGFSLTALFILSKTYPEITSELKLIIENSFEQETPAFKSRAKKILCQLG